MSAAILRVLAIRRSSTALRSTTEGKAHLDVGGNTFARYPANIGADQLDGCHQWERQWHGPQHVEAELSASLRISRDTAWIVVSHARNEPGSNPRQRVILHTVPNDLSVLIDRVDLEAIRPL